MQMKPDKNSLAVSPFSVIYFYLTLVLFAGKGNVKGETFNLTCLSAGASEPRHLGAGGGRDAPRSQHDVWDH